MRGVAERVVRQQITHTTQQPAAVNALVGCASRLPSSAANTHAKATNAASRRPQPCRLRFPLFALLPSHTHSRGSSGAPKRRAVTMMPVSTPKVLVRPQGQRQYEWVDLWESYVSES